jgi:cell wall-associated NlpC family hydrolase
MFVRKSRNTIIAGLAAGMLLASAAWADEDMPTVVLTGSTSLGERTTEVAATSEAETTATIGASLLQRTSTSIEQTLNGALDLIGIRYRRGGSTPERGFDCSGFVSHVFREGLGLYLPRSAREMSQTGEPVAKTELQPGDLVFFKTVRRTVSHVGIYLGDHLFVHAPRTGARVRVEDMDGHYWAKRFSGARRVAVE